MHEQEARSTSRRYIITVVLTIMHTVPMMS
jgi:hypothetical protein